MSEEWLERVRAFAAGLGLGPEHHDLITRAFTHRSIGDEATLGDNERLEFLGDTILALVVCEHLYLTFPTHSEGQLTKLKQRYVSEPTLADAASSLGLGALLAMASGDEGAGGRERPSTLCDLFEAVLAAVYLAGGIEAAREFVRANVIERVDPNVVWDYKSRLQELFQEKHGTTPFYRTAPSSGPAHAPVFHSTVVATSEAAETVLGEGTGRNKKIAEQCAAQDALARLEKPKRKSRKKVAPEGTDPGVAAG
jgi:ribonuclease-3